MPSCLPANGAVSRVFARQTTHAFTDGKERLCQHAIAEYKVAEVVARRCPDPEERQSRLEDIASKMLNLNATENGTRWDPAASLKVANNPATQVYTRAHAMRDLVNFSDDLKEQLRRLKELDSFLVGLGKPTVNKECPVCLDHFYDDAPTTTRGLFRVSMCNHVLHVCCLAKMNDAADDRNEVSGVSGVFHGTRCPTCNNLMQAGLSLSKMTGSGARIASSATARVARPIASGDRVQIIGLRLRCEFNGRVGKAFTLSSGRWTVGLDGDGSANASVKVKVDNLMIAEEHVPFDRKHQLDLLEAQEGIIVRPELIVFTAHPTGSGQRAADAEDVSTRH